MFIVERTLKGLGAQQGGVHTRLAGGFALAYFFATLLYLVEASCLFPAFMGSLLGGFVFCMGPGLALYSLLSLRRVSTFSLPILLVLSCSLGFTFNFLWNLVVYLAAFSIDQATAGYLLVVCALYGGLLLRWYRRGEGALLMPDSRHWRGGIFVVAGLMLVAWAFAQVQPPGFYVEELMVLRKVFENPGITANSISFQAGAHTTYYFIPFYLMLAMTATFAGIDVFQAVPGLWPFTAAVSLLCLVMIARLIGGGWAAPLALAVSGLFGAFLFVHPTSNLFTLLAPFPDRYALAAGVLIPLALFHFLVHVGEEKVSLAAFVGLVYLIVEITFIHARETLFFIAIVLLCAAMAAVDWKGNRALIQRITGLVVVVASVLVVYRLTNLSLQPELSAFIGLLRQDMVDQLSAGIALHGWPAWFGIPQFHGPHIPDAFDYGDRFGLWRHYAEIAFLPLVIGLLPLYVWIAPRPSLLLAPASIALFGLFSLFQGVRLAIGIAVGAPFIFDIFSVVFLLAFLVLADMARIMAALLVAPNAGNDGWRWPWLIAICAAILLLIARDGMPYAMGGPYREMLLYLAVLGIIVWRLLRWKWHGTGTVLPLWAGRVAALACLAEPGRLRLVSVILLVMVVLYAGLTQQGGKLPVRSAALDGPPAESMRSLDAERLFIISAAHDLSLPEALAEYVRSHMPVGQIWFGSHTAGVMLSSAQYSSVVSFSGHMEEGFEANNNFLVRLHGLRDRDEMRKRGVAHRSSLGQLMVEPGMRARLLDYLDSEKVDWLIAIPEDEPHLAKAFAEEPALARRFLEKAAAEGYVIYRYLRQ